MDPIYYVVERSHVLFSSPTLFSFTQITKEKRKRKRAPLTNYEKWWPSEPEQDFIQSSVQWCAGKCLKTNSEWGRGSFVAFADVSGINTMAQFKLPMWSQPADKIPESLISDYELTLAHHWDSSLIPQQDAFMWLPNCTRVHNGPGRHA